jgi:predicted O-methyltransferase YrrM
MSVPDTSTSTPADPLVERLAGVEGWLHIDEARRLYQLIRSWPVGDEPLTLVEIGSWKGRSSITMATALQDAGVEGRVWAIDPHKGSVEHVEMWGEVDTYDEFLANIERSGAAPRIEPLRMASHDARPTFGDRSVDLLFIDGSHEYVDVRRDIDDWLSALREPAVVGFNDSSWPGVYRALRERVLSRGTPFRSPELVRSTLFARYDPDAPWTAAERDRWRRVSLVLGARRAAHPIVPRLPESVKRAANQITRRLTG